MFQVPENRGRPPVQTSNVYVRSSSCQCPCMLTEGTFSVYSTTITDFISHNSLPRFISHDCFQVFVICIVKSIHFMSGLHDDYGWFTIHKSTPELVTVHESAPELTQVPELSLVFALGLLNYRKNHYHDYFGHYCNHDYFTH